MTDQPTDLVIAQRHRDAAAKMYGPGLGADQCRAGNWDDTDIVRSYAEFERDHFPRSYAEGVEDAARLVEQYHCLACGASFHQSEGHWDEDCAKGRSSWDRGLKDPDKLAALIRALTSNGDAS